MATYKVIQDVEAEDKLVGPLTFRQFVYAGIAAVFGYLCYFLIAHGAGFLAVPFLPIVIIGGFFAWPWGRDQPTELWALAKIRFFFKPRRRIWDQSGAKELVTVTAPRKMAVNYTNGLSQVEVKSRLKVLADTLDSRGWVMRNADVNTAATQTIQQDADASSDRLVATANLPKPKSDTVDVKASDDIMDPQNNPIAKQFDDMIAASAQAHRQQIINNLQQATPDTPTANPTPSTPGGNSRWFFGQPLQPSVSTPQNAVTFNAQVVTPGAPITSLPVTPATPTPDEEAFIKQVEQEDTQPDAGYAHLHTIQPLTPERLRAENARKRLQQQASTAPAGAAPVAPALTPPPPQQPVTQPGDTGILDLASNNDLNVATIAREAQKRRPQDEVVISLH